MRVSLTNYKFEPLAFEIVLHDGIRNLIRNRPLKCTAYCEIWRPWLRYCLYGIISRDWYRLLKICGFTLLYWTYTQRNAGRLYDNWLLRKNPCLTDCKDTKYQNRIYFPKVNSNCHISSPSVMTGHYESLVDVLGFSFIYNSTKYSDLAGWYHLN